MIILHILLLIIIVFLLVFISILDQLLNDKSFGHQYWVWKWRLAYDLSAVMIPPIYNLSEIFEPSLGTFWWFKIHMLEPFEILQIVTQFHVNIVINRDNYYGNSNANKDTAVDKLTEFNIARAVDVMKRSILNLMPHKSTKNENQHIIDQYFAGKFHQYSFDQ